MAVLLFLFFYFVTPSIAVQPFQLTNELTCPDNQHPQYTTTPNFEVIPPQTSATTVTLSGDGGTLAVADPIFHRMRVYRKTIDWGYTDGKNTVTESWEQAGQDVYNRQNTTASISLSDDGTVLAVGAFWDVQEEDGNVTNHRDFQVLVRDTSTTSYYDDDFDWIDSGADINGKFPDDSLTSISISGEGDVVAVSAVYHTGVKSIHDVRVFRWADRWNYYENTWSQIGQDILRESYNYHDFQYSNVAISKNGLILAINGDVYDDSYGFSTNWYASIYERDEASTLGWKQIGQELTGIDGYQYESTSVKLSKSGDVVAVGAVYYHRGGYFAHVRVYQRSELYGWTQVGSDLELDGTTSLSLSLSDDGSVLAFGATRTYFSYSYDPYHLDNDSYSIYNTDFGVFRRDPSSTLGWTKVQVSYESSPSYDYNEPGSFVSLSSDGSILAVGGQKDYPDYDKDMKLYHLSCTSTSGSSSTSKTTTTSTATLAITITTLVLVIAMTISNYLMYRNIVKEKTSYMKTPSDEISEAQV